MFAREKKVKKRNKKTANNSLVNRGRERKKLALSTFPSRERERERERGERMHPIGECNENNAVICIFTGNDEK